MGAMVPRPHWIPEDDVLLKSAVEAGASLESLAKGAVQFSRRYTVKELQDRWCSLLYDPVIATEASPHMFEVVRSVFLDQSRPNKFEVLKETSFSSGKRKAESIRKCYYAMRKRICSEPFDMLGINILPRLSTSSFGDGDELPSADGDLGIQCQNSDIGPHSFSQFGPHTAGGLQFGGKGVSHNLSFAYEDNNDLSLNPGFDQSKELPLSDLFKPEGLENEGNAFSEIGDRGPFRNFACSSSSMPQMPMWDNTFPDISLPVQVGEQDQQTGDTFIIPPPGNANETEDYLVELSNTLFDDDLIFLDNNGKEPIDKSYYDGFSSLLLDSPSQSGLPSGESEIPAGGHFGDDHKAADPQLAASTSAVKGFSPECRNGVICCTLNTEDPEIPSNEDVFLPFRFPSPSSSPYGAHWRLEDPSYLASLSVNDYSSTREANGGPPVIKKNQKDSSVPSRVVGLSQPLGKGLKYPIGDKGVKFELPKSSIQHAALRKHAKNGEVHSSCISSANVTANRYIGGIVKRGSVEMDRAKNLDYESVGIRLDKHERGLEVLDSLQNNNNVKADISNLGSPDGNLSCQKAINPQPVDKSQLSDLEEWSENDVPDFSDVEAMILDMDLSPDESYIYTNPEVQRYLHDESKRTIIRLEQAADACTRRAIASQGAFAVLYGRCSKHFIKKPEVILGRATEENKVDIDLGREKNGGKISRRQAIIKLDMHGIFQLINVGKSSIHVNGKVAAPGQSLSLTSGCLIEVRGLAFIFETNRTRINKYVNSIEGGNLPLDHRPLNGS